MVITVTDKLLGLMYVTVHVRDDERHGILQLFLSSIVIIIIIIIIITGT